MSTGTGDRPGRTVGVVPLFNPTAAIEPGMRSLAAQVDALVLVDDGSADDPTALVESFRLPGVLLLRSSTNAGIATALNRGVDVAVRQLGAAYVLTTDQDSVLADDYVEQALAAARRLEERGIRYTAVAAGCVNGRITPGRRVAGLPYETTLETIQSGMLFPASALERLGPFDESFFIDCVDTDYILRGARAGRPTVLVPECRMTHAMGAGIPVRLPFFFRRRERTVAYHGPVRRYYIMRNRARLLLRFGPSSLSWAVQQTAEQIKLMLADLVYGPNPRGQLRASALGVWDGLRARGGRIDQRRVAQILRRQPAENAT